MVIINIIIVALVLGIIVYVILYLEKEYKDRIYIDISTEDRYRILNRCDIVTFNGTVEGVIYQKEATECAKYYVMESEKFFSTFMKLSNFEEYERDLKW